MRGNEDAWGGGIDFSIKEYKPQASIHIDHNFKISVTGQLVSYHLIFLATGKSWMKLPRKDENHRKNDPWPQDCMCLTRMLFVQNNIYGDQHPRHQKFRAVARGLGRLGSVRGKLGFTSIWVDEDSICQSIPWNSPMEASHEGALPIRDPSCKSMYKTEESDPSSLSQLNPNNE